MESDVFEWHADLCRPPVRVEMSSALPDPIWREVLAVAPALQRIHLNAMRIHEEVICQLSRSAGIETEPDPIFGKRRVTTADGRSDFFRLAVDAAEREIEGLVVVGDPHVRGLGSLFTAHRVVGFPRA